MAWLDRLDGVGLVLLAAAGPAVVLLTVLWFEVAVASLRHLGGRERRRRAASDLHGHATLLGRRFLRRLAKRKGILLGQWSGRPTAPLIGWSLEGSAITVAPPRTGKGALIALNLLSPDRRGFGGSTVTIDPRGELWCIAARRRRELGRRVVLLDPFGVAKAHRDAFDDCHLPDVRSATYNPLEFIRDDDSLAVRDINVLLDALLTPPRPGAHENSRHFYESARAIVAGYMAWVRFREPAHRRTLKTLHEMLSASPEAREGFAKAFRKEEPFAGGLARIAVERQAQVGEEEGGSNFTTIANQLAFLNYPELLRNTARSTFDPSVLAEGNTDLFVVAPEETVEHVKGWLRLWVAIPNAVAGRTPLERDMLIVIDEMPRIGFLKPVMDGYTMAAGKGVHFWCFAQSISALDSSWGKEHRRTLLHLAEVVQVLGFPRTDAEGAEELSKAIGNRHLRGPHREQVRHRRREPHRHRKHPVAGGRVHVPGARAAGHARRADDAGTRPAIRDRGGEGPAARRPSPAPCALLAAPRFGPPGRPQPVRAAQAGGRAAGRRDGSLDMAADLHERRTDMNTSNPGMSKRSPPHEAAGDGGPEGGAEDARPAVLDEILGRLEVIGERLEERKCPPAGPTKAAFDKLAKAVAAVGESVGETGKVVGRLAETDPDYKAAVDAAVELSGKLDSCRGDFGIWVEGDRRKRRRWKAAALAAAVPAALLLGVLVEQQFQLIPIHDPSGGWSGWIWETHGPAIVDCAVEARRTDAEVDCALAVRRP